MSLVPAIRTGLFPTIEFYGHSYAQLTTSGASRYGQRWTDRLAKMLGAKQINYANNGARLCWHESTGNQSAGGWNSAANAMSRLRTITRAAGSGFPPESALQAFYFGINDWSMIGTAKIGVNGPFGHALRYLLARGRCSRVFASNDTSIAYTGTWTSDVTLTHGTPTVTGGEVAHASTVTGGVATITVPAEFSGGTIDFFFTADPTAGANTVRIAKTAGAGTNAQIVTGFQIAGTAVTDNSATDSAGTQPAVGSRFNGIVYRVTGLAAGTHTFTVTFTIASGQVMFQGWGVESPVPPAQLVFNQPKIPAGVGYGLWAIGGSHGFQGTTDQGPVTDAMVTSGNATIASVVSEFDAACQVVDVDAKLGQSALYWPAGDAHPNDAGQALIASAGFDVLRRLVQQNALDAQALQAVDQPFSTVLSDAAQSAGTLVGIGAMGMDLALMASSVITSYTLVANTEQQLANMFAFVQFGQHSQFRVCATVGGTAVAGSRLYLGAQPIFGYQTLDGVAAVHTGAFEYGYCDISSTGARHGPWVDIHPSFRRGNYAVAPFIYGATAGTVGLYAIHVQLR